MSNIKPPYTAQFQATNILARQRPRLLDGLVYSKWFWLIGMAALLLTLAACSSSQPTAEQIGGPTGLPSDPAAPTSSLPNPANDATATLAPTTPAPSQMEEEAREEFLGTPVPGLPDDPTQLMNATFGESLADVARKMVVSGDKSFIPVLIEFLRFQTGGEPTFSIASFLNKLLEGPDTVIVPPERTNWDWWIEWLGQNPQIQPPEGFAAWKGDLYSIIDPGLGDFLYDGVKTEIRLEEVVWGGVRKDGIPDLQNPPVVTPSEADYLGPEDRVFGVSINGEHRAYPLRILNLHEMANDVVGGVPFALAY